MKWIFFFTSRIPLIWHSLMLKVARVVNIKLFFHELILLIDLIILIRKCETPFKNLDTSLLLLRKQLLCLKNWNLWQAATTIEFNIFNRNFIHVSYVPMSIKGCSGFFYFVLILSYMQKSKRLSFYIFINNSKSKKNNKKKNPERPFKDIVK